MIEQEISVSFRIFFSQRDKWKDAKKILTTTVIVTKTPLKDL